MRNAKVSRNRLSALGTLLLHVLRNRSKAYGSEPYASTMHLPAGVCVMSETTFLSATTAGFGAPSGSGQERSPMRAVQIFVRVVALHGGDRQRTILSYLISC